MNGYPFVVGNLGQISRFFEMQPQQLSEEQWAKYLDNKVFAALDVFLVDPGGLVYLALRKREPAKGLWWCIGGERTRGSAIRADAAGIIYRKLRVRIEPMAFELLDADDVIFGHRLQEPQVHGLHAACTVLYARVSRPVAEAIVSDPAEHELGAWFDLRSVRADVLAPPVGGVASHFHERMARYAEQLSELFRNRVNR